MTQPTNPYAAALPDIAARIAATADQVLGTSRIDGDDAADMQVQLLHKLRVQLDTMLSTAQKLADDYTNPQRKAMTANFASYVVLDPMLLYTV